MITPPNAEETFNAFISEKKFYEGGLYPGIEDEALRPLLTSFINQAAEDFRAVSRLDHPTTDLYNQKLEIGLNRFSEIYNQLDTEDRERVCEYFEELMDIVNLESSNGQLNKFMYDFDPNTE